MEQGLRLHQVGVHLAPVGERAYAGAEGLHVAFHDELPAVCLRILIAELYHFLKFPFRVDVHQREGRFARGKCLLGQTHHDGRVFADAVEHHGILKFGCHFTDDVDGLCLEFFQVAEFIGFFFHAYRFVYVGGQCVCLSFHRLL